MISQPPPLLQRARRFMVVLLAVLVLSAACGGDNSAGEGVEAPVCAAGQIDGDLIFTLLIWEDYIPEELVAKFERRYGIDVEHHTYTSNSEMLSLIQVRAEAYDVAVPSDYMVDIMKNDGLLLPLDPIALPGRINVDPLFDDAGYDRERRYSMPYLWGTVGIGVNRNVVGDDFPHSWSLLFDPEVSTEFAGRMSLLDDHRQALAAALIYLGFSPNTKKREEVAAAADLILGVAPNLAEFDSEDYAASLADGALDVAHGRSDVFIDSFGTTPTDYQYIIPAEGAVAWVDNMVIPITAQHPCTAHSFIDFILEARTGADLANYKGYASPNLAAYEFIPDEVLNNPAFYPPQAARETLQFLEDIDDSDWMYVNEFSRGQES